MPISSVLLACNDNTNYLDFWPLVKEAWLKVANLPCIMIYVGQTLPEILKSDPTVKFFKAIEGWSTATQAKCIRLLYPALLQDEGMVLISDMNIMPLQSEFYNNGFNKFNENCFVIFKGVDEEERPIPTCYYAATPSIWGSVFGIKKVEDVRLRLQEWHSKNKGSWLEQEQLDLFTIISLWRKDIPDTVNITQWTKPMLRLFNPILTVKKNTYIDFRMPNYNEFSKEIHEILESIAP